MDGLAVWKTTPKGSVMNVPHGTDQLLIFPLTGEANLQRGKELIKLGEHATMIKRDADNVKLRLIGDATLLVLYRLKQQKTVENVTKAKRAGLYPHSPTATAQKKEGTPSSTRSGPLGTVDIERWRIRAGQEEDPDLAPYLCALEKGEHTLRRKYERSLAEQVVQESGDYEVKDRLLAKKVRLSSGE